MPDTKRTAKNSAPDPMTAVLADFRKPTTQDWGNAWVGMEPTFQSRKSVEKWAKLAAKGPIGEDEYFHDEYMLGTQRAVAQKIKKKYEEKRKDDDRAWCMFEDVDLNEELDQWGVRRQNLEFKWKDKKQPDFQVRFTIDPETFEYSIKPVPVAWFLDPRFVRFLDEFLWEVPMKEGLSASIAHGGAQFSFSAKTFLTGSLLADDIATRLNHPELATWIMDWPNPDDRPVRATGARFAAFRNTLEAYWSGAFHPRAIGVLSVESAYLDRGFGPAAQPPKGLVDGRTGPIGSAQEIFQTNFAFGRAVRLQAQNVHPGYWQSSHPKEEGYRPDQIMRYSEVNLNRLQIAGEWHVKSGKPLQPDRAPDLREPLDVSHLTDEASYENRGQMGRTSARDFVEALLLDVHHCQYLQAHPRVKVAASILQDQLLGDAEKTIQKHGGEKLLARLKAQARKDNKDASRERLNCDWIEPETLFWAAWKQLPAGEKGAIAREAIHGFVERVEQAASMDRRSEKPSDDPMEWHRHRIHPELWKALQGDRGGAKAGDPATRELGRWEAAKATYEKRRPVFTHTDIPEPW